MAEIFLEKVSHTYPRGNVLAVEEVNITLADGSNNALLGPSGCGKTTLMKIIAGLLKPTRGRVYYDGEDVTDLSPQDRNIAMVFQFPVLYDMTVLDNLMFPLLNKKTPKKAARETAKQIAETLGLTPVLQKRAKDIDMGARQRVTLGRALVRKPSAFLMDEPLSSIEPEGKWHLKMQIKEIQHTLKQTLIYVTHDQSEALTLADKIVVMHNGKLLQYSSVDEVYNSPASTFVGYFIGDPGMNFIECTLEDRSLNCGNFTHDISKKNLDGHGTQFQIGIRPEHVAVSRNEEEDWIPAKLVAVENLGNMKILYLESGQHTVKAKMKAWDDSEGGSVWVRFPDDYIKIFDSSGGLVV